MFYHKHNHDIQERMFPGTGHIMRYRIIDHANQIYAWELGENFLLFTKGAQKSNELLVTSHGGYLPWSGNARVPTETTLRFLAPHGLMLTDPHLSNIIHKPEIPSYSAIRDTSYVPLGRTAAQPFILKDLAGTDKIGYVKNYILTKYKRDNYTDIAKLMTNSHFYKNLVKEFPDEAQRQGLGGGIAIRDILTIRNRAFMLPTNLKTLFSDLIRHGIHYKEIIHVHCRNGIGGTFKQAYSIQENINSINP